MQRYVGHKNLDSPKTIKHKKRIREWKNLFSYRKDWHLIERKTIDDGRYIATIYMEARFNIADVASKRKRQKEISFSSGIPAFRDVDRENDRSQRNPFASPTIGLSTECE